MAECYAEHVMRGSDLGENRIVAGMRSPVDVIGGCIQVVMVATYALTHNEDGTLLVDASGALSLKSLAMDDGTLSIEMDSDENQIAVEGTVYVEGVDLILDLSNYHIENSTSITLIRAGAINGQFNSVAAEGYSVILEYNGDNIVASVEANKLPNQNRSKWVVSISDRGYGKPPFLSLSRFMKRQFDISLVLFYASRRDVGARRLIAKYGSQKCPHIIKRKKHERN